MNAGSIGCLPWDIPHEKINVAIEFFALKPIKIPKETAAVCKFPKNDEEL
jgi:hypothetical protein